MGEGGGPTQVEANGPSRVWSPGAGPASLGPRPRRWGVARGRRALLVGRGSPAVAGRATGRLGGRRWCTWARRWACSPGAATRGRRWCGSRSRTRWSCSSCAGSPHCCSTARRAPPGAAATCGSAAPTSTWRCSCCPSRCSSRAASAGQEPLLGGQQSAPWMFFIWHFAFAGGLIVAVCVFHIDRVRHRRPDLAVEMWPSVVGVLIAALLSVAFVAVPDTALRPTLVAPDVGPDAVGARPGLAPAGVLAGRRGPRPVVPARGRAHPALALGRAAPAARCRDREHERQQLVVRLVLRSAVRHGRADQLAGVPRLQPRAGWAGDQHRGQFRHAHAQREPCQLHPVDGPGDRCCSVAGAVGRAALGGPRRVQGRERPVRPPGR